MNDVKNFVRRDYKTIVEMVEEADQALQAFKDFLNDDQRQKLLVFRLKAKAVYNSICITDEVEDEFLEHAPGYEQALLDMTTNRYPDFYSIRKILKNTFLRVHQDVL